MRLDALQEKVKTLIHDGQYFLALDCVLPALEQARDDLELNHLAASALIRIGADKRAEQILLPLLSNNQADEESAGLLARLYKNIWLQSRQIDDARRSRDAYLLGYEKSGGYYTGVNAATLSWIVGEKQRAREIAGEIKPLCNKLIDSISPDERFWLHATLGEVNLILGEMDLAIESYKNAAFYADKKHSMIISSLQQLKLMLNNGFEVPEILFEILKPPTIVAFTGHMIDMPGRKQARFPLSIEQAVAEEMERVLEKMDAQIGYASAACGADIIFAEKMLERGAEVNLFMPFNIDDFIETSVAHAGAGWVERFYKIVDASIVRYASKEKYLGDNVLFDYANRVIFGYSILRSQLMETKPHLLSVLDRSSKIVAGGTGHAVEQWPFKDRLEVIETNKILKRVGPGDEIKSLVKVKNESHDANKNVSYKRVIKALMFADFVGFSKLDDEQTPLFLNEFLGKVARGLKDVTPDNCYLNTWGDAVFAAMDDALQIAEYALTLNDLVNNGDWESLGLKEKVGIRIALHAGPVFHMKDHVTGKANYYGYNVNRTARLEPVTVGGYVYTTEQFASLLMADLAEAKRDGGAKNISINSFECEYIGTLSLAKEFGAEPVYRIRRSRY